MEKDETLKAQYGTRRPFSVPEGYFAQLPDALMRQIQTADSAPPSPVHAIRQPLWQRLSPLVAAACMVGIIVLVGRGVRSLSPKSTVTATVEAPSGAPTAHYTDELDRMADYTMLDDDDVYAYLSSE